MGTHQNAKGDIVLIGGCFDLLHAGHLHLIKHAKGLGGQLWVGVLSDRYIRGYKGPNRPIQPEGERLALVESIRYVDKAFLTDEDPYCENTINKIRPAVIVIGLEEGKNERKRAHAARVVAAVPGTRIEFLERYRSGEVSTSNIIDRIHYVEAPDSQGLS